LHRRGIGTWRIVHGVGEVYQHWLSTGRQQDRNDHVYRYRSRLAADCDADRIRNAVIQVCRPQTLAGATRDVCSLEGAKEVHVNTGVSSSSAPGQALRRATRRMLTLAGGLLVATAMHAAVAADAPGDPSAVARVEAQAVVQASGTERTVAFSKATRSPAVSPLDRRIALLARELDLDAAQKLKVRSLLEGQREQIVRAWQDESVPGALRVARTQAISERTEDGIRALLTDAQRQKYVKPRTDRAIGGTPDDLANYVDTMDRR
jgi:hypothetical protein